MSLPPLIEIVPLDKPVRAELSVPGSKSVTNRALVLAALADGETVLRGALWSEDTQVMVECLKKLSFAIRVETDPHETANRTITVTGQGGAIAKGGSMEHPLELHVGNAGTAARFLAAMVALGQGCYRLHGVARMHDRPQKSLFDALRELGYCIDSVNCRLPAVIHAGGRRSGTCCVSIEESSQFASALLLCANTGGWHVTPVGVNADESPYLEMTRQLCQVFPVRGGVFQIEPDASSGSYFWAAGALQSSGPKTGITVANWPDSGWQVDARFPKFLPLPSRLSRQTDLGDAIMTAIVLAPLARHRTKFTDLGRLRVQECERVEALHKELKKCGAKILEREDTLEISPSQLHGAEIETYRDHRMAMCFAILGLKVPGIKIKNPACVKKTFPNFFQKLAAPPPEGLGAVILDAASGRALEYEALFAT